MSSNLLLLLGLLSTCTGNCLLSLITFTFRKKKSKLASAGKYTVSGDDGVDVRPKKSKSSHKKKVSTNDKVVGKDKPADIQGEPENSSSPEIDETGDDKTNLGR